MSPAAAQTRREAPPVAPPRFPRLLEGVRPDGRALTLAEHLELHGAAGGGGRSGRGAELAEVLVASGLLGRGGGGFPAGRKLQAVASRRGRAVVVANGTEGEPASGKDKALLRTKPHLVLDGVALAAAAIGAEEAIVAVGRSAERERAVLERGLAERRERRLDAVRIRVESAPDRFVAGEETALLQWLNGGPAKPTTVPPRPFERGVGGRPTLVQNVETLAHVALIARFGAAWFRELGTPEEPGTALVTLGGAVRQPGVYEIPLGTTLDRLVATAGGATGPIRAFLVGGYFGAWIDGRDGGVRLLDAELGERGAALGARAVVALPEGACGLVEAARVARYLAGESAGQCGPCRFGLAAIADAMAVLVTAKASPAVVERVERWLGQVAGRGACRHPDGAARFVGSTLEVFGDEVELHLRGRCSGRIHGNLLPLQSAQPDGWR